MSEKNKAQLIEENVNASKVLMRKFMDNWFICQDEAVQDNVGFFVFPHLVKLGGMMTMPLLISSSDEMESSQVFNHVQKMCKDIIVKIAEVMQESSFEMNTSSFDSTDEIDLLYDSIGEELSQEFSEFLQENKILVENKEMGNSEEEIDNLARAFAFGYATILEAFRWIECHMTDDDDEELKIFLESFQKEYVPQALAMLIISCHIAQSE